MDLLTQYFDLQKRIYEFFGYVEDWVVIPLDDNREEYWYLDQRDRAGGVVYFSPDELSPANIETGEKLYTNLIYTQRFLPKWVYRAETDGNKFLSVFSNDKELTDPTPEQVAAFGLW
jgi:hypothetical protein